MGAVGALACVGGPRMGVSFRVPDMAYAAYAPDMAYAARMGVSFLVPDMAYLHRGRPTWEPILRLRELTSADQFSAA